MKSDPSLPRRTLIKGLSFEAISNLVGLWLAYLWFGDFNCCLIFTLVCFAVKLAIFYFHERLWHQFDWGREKGN